MSVYVSITGLTPHTVLHYPLFWWHAVLTFHQAKAADGNLFTDVRQVGAVHHSLTVWRARSDMVAYLKAGAHKRALRVYRHVGLGRVHGYESEYPPRWSEALDLWANCSRPV